MRRRRQEGPRAEGWWQDGDGRWYPPSGARHPAGLGDAHAARAAAKQDAAHRRRVWMFWGALLVPLLLLAGVFLSMVDFATGPHSDPTDAATSGGGRGRASSTAGTTGEETTTVPGVAAEAPTEPSVAAAEGQSSSDSGATTASSSESPAAGGPGGEEPAGSPRSSGRSHDGDADEDDDEDDDQDDDGEEAPPPGTGTTSPPTTTSTTAPPTVRVPDDAEDCKRGGWADHTDDQGNPFPNQGQCIAFVQGSSG
jgi:hypothetical protein